MKTALFLAAALLLAVTGTLGGRITPWADADIYYPNSGRVQYMDLYFQLDNRLPAGHVLRVTLPFTTSLALNSSATASTSTVYLAASFSKGAFASTAAASLTVAATPSFVRLSSGAPYTAYFTFNNDLAAATPYVFKLVFSTSPSDAAGFLGYVQMETLSPAQSIVNTSSTLSDTGITYDLNNAFAPIQLFAAPGTNTTFTINSDANSTAAGATSVRQISIVPSSNFFYWPLLQITWENSNFTVSNLVNVDSGVNTTTAIALAAGTAPNQYSYTQSGTTINLFHNAPLLTNQTIKYNITTVNVASQTITFSLKILHRYNNNLTDIITATGIAIQAASGGSGASSTVAFNSSAYQIFVSWGIDIQSTSLTTTGNALSKVFNLYASAATNKIFQAVRFGFGLNGTLPTGTYQVNVTICTTTANCDVLENSLYTNMQPSTGCFYNWGYGTVTTKFIACNVTTVAQAGNQIGGRIWLSSALATTPADHPTTINDAQFGTISIASLSNTSFVTLTQSIVSGYNRVNVDAPPLANINGNGPLAGIPSTASLATLQTGVNYADLWTGTGGIAPSTAVDFAAYTANMAAMASPYNTAPASVAGSAQGGIFGVTSANTKYNFALFTTANFLGAASSFGVNAQNPPAMTGNMPGIDIFMNPNIYSFGGTASGTNSAIQTCWAGNQAFKAADLTNTAYTSTVATETGAKPSAHCFTNNFASANTNYLRLRYLITSTSTALLTLGGANNAPQIDAAATTKYLTFFWENAVTISNSYAGASLKADSNIGDFYGVMYTLTPPANNPVFPIKSGGTNPIDIGELNSTGMNSFTYTFGTAFFWSQMIMGPYGIGWIGTDAALTYYNKKSVFLSGVISHASAVSTGYNTLTQVQLIRIRGLLNSDKDTGLYPSTGKIALFIGHLDGTTIFEPLAGANTTNFNGASGYNVQTGVPLVGNGAIRCWNAGLIGNCVHERYGRNLPAATYATSNTVGGATNFVDHYQIITSDASYNGANFSISILMKPTLGDAASFAKHYYRFGFVSNSSAYYIQTWDSFFDNGASQAAATGIVTGAGYAFDAATAASVLAPSGSTCALPYSSANGATTPAIRILPGTNDLDNNVASANISLYVQAYGATGVTTAKFQGHAIWCAQWNFRVNSPNISSAALENTALNDKCATFDYLTTESTSSPPALYCMFCPIAGSSAVPATGASSLSATISNFWDGPAQNIPTPVITNLAGDTGILLENSYCATTVGSSNSIWTPQTITITTAPSSYYAISGQKITIQFNAPSTLATTLVDTITITGRISGSANADTSFPYGSLDGNSVCRLVPTGSITNYSSYVTCTATVGSNAITITSIGAITSTATQWTLYIWGFIGGTAAANTTASYIMQTYKGSTTYIVDQSSTTNTAYAQWALSNTTSALTLASPVYQRPYIGARGWFKFDIGFTPRTWFYSDRVVINLDAVGSATVNANASVVKCRITDAADSINYGFQSCTLSLGAAPTVTILALQPSGTISPYDFATGNGVRVYLENMVTTTQTTKMIYGSVAFAGSGSGSASVLSKVINATVTDISPSTLTTTAFPTGYPTVTKLWYSANDFQDLVFNFPTSTAFNSSCRIAIVFPSYYNPGLITRSNAPYCTINNVYTQCLVGDVSSSGVATLAKGQRQLIIYGFSGSVSANGTISVRVGGISSPQANYSTETFWVQINGDNTDSASTIMYGGSVTDQSYVTPTASIFPLNVVWFGVGATATRSTTAFTWSFGLNNATATVGTSSAIQAIFPESWGLAWGEFAPTCQITDFTSNTTTYSAAISASTGNNSIFGNLVTMNISTAIPAGAVVNLTCSGVRTPNLDGYYRSQDVQIRVVDANGTFTYLRSAPGQHNVNFTYYFAKGSSQSYVSWADASNFTNPLPLTAGTYNLKVTATVPSKATRSFTITPSNTQFAFLSSTAPFWIVTGATSNSTNLGCAQTVPVGVYALYFSVSDNSSTYVAPPVMWVNVNNNAQVITPSATTLTTYFQSTSVVSTTAPLVFDLTNFPPYSDVTITPNITVAGNTNFTVSPASIRLTAAAPKAYFTFSSTATASATGSSSYTFTLSGTNAAAYSLASTVTVNLQSDSGSGAVNTPVLTVAADTTTDTFSPTMKPLLFTLTQVTQATVYWVITLQGQSITDINTIVTNAAALTQYSAQSANQAQYFTNFLVASARNSLTVSNLWPNTGYTVSAVAVSQTSRNSTVATFSFATGVNGAPVQRWLFNYTTYPVLSVRQSLLCTITQTLAVPASNVRDVNGEICGNSTSFYANQNSTGDLAIYFYPLQANADTTMTATNLNAILNATDAVRQAFNSSLNSVASNTGFLNIWSDFAYIPRQAPNLTIPTTIAASSLTTSSINLALASINETGFLFVALCSNTSTAPTAVQMKQAAANISSITGLVSLQVIYYYPGAVPTYNFTGLSTATSYNLYVAAGNNDPSFLQNFTAVTTIPVTTASTNSGSSASQIGVILSVMTVFASVISLMFF